MSCLYSRRGHTWRELGAVPMATGVIDHARRACAKCGAPGYVDKQGRVIFGISSISGDGKRRDLGRA